MNKLNSINAEEIQRETMNQIAPIVKSYVDALIFNFIYHTKVSDEQEEITSKALKEYRDVFWSRALEKANGDEEKAFEIYTQNLNELN